VNDCTGVRVGLSGLETSHPAAFLPLLRAMGCTVSGVHDAGDVSPKDHVADFAREHGVPILAPSVDALAEQCDVVMLLGCDWDRRVPEALRLVDAGVAVCVDKPVAGTPADLRKLAAAAKTGRLSGGSSLRFAPEVTQWTQNGDHSIVEAATWCGGHPFYYGVHAVTLALACAGSGRHVAVVESACSDQTSLAGADSVLSGRIRLDTGVFILVDVRLDRPAGGFRASLKTADGTRAIVPDAAMLYQAYLAAVVAGLAGRAPLPVRGDDLIAPELALLALARSADLGGWEVSPEELGPSWRPWPGRAFATAYAQSREGGQSPRQST